ncbi:hypothetical protein BC829DRAFT_159164 [Chytridium lagenaria]|nr:hypothetical protein BC829DRAFT_159164 [Chytridium lagenaria]
MIMPSMLVFRKELGKKNKRHYVKGRYIKGRRKRDNKEGPPIIRLKYRTHPQPSPPTPPLPPPSHPSKKHITSFPYSRSTTWTSTPSRQAVSPSTPQTPQRGPRIVLSLSQYLTRQCRIGDRHSGRRGGGECTPRVRVNNEERRARSQTLRCWGRRVVG